MDVNKKLIEFVGVIAKLLREEKLVFADSESEKEYLDALSVVEDQPPTFNTSNNHELARYVMAYFDEHPNIDMQRTRDVEFDDQIVYHYSARSKIAKRSYNFIFDKEKVNLGYCVDGRYTHIYDVYYDHPNFKAIVIDTPITVLSC